MPSTYTSSLRLEQIADGEQDETWGDTVNRQLQLIDSAIAGAQTLNVTGGPMTLTANNGVADQSRQAVLVLQGALTSDLTLYFQPVTQVVRICNNTTDTTGGTLNIYLTVLGDPGAPLAFPSGWGGTFLNTGTTLVELSPTQEFINIGLRGNIIGESGLNPVTDGVVGLNLGGGAIQLNCPTGGTTAVLSSAYDAGTPNSGSLAQLYSGSAAHIVGSITNNGASTSYNTTSDRRLKARLTRMAGALDRLARLRSYRGVYRSHPHRVVDMMIADEVAAVLPEAVTGEPEAVDEAGDPIYQQLDASKLVPLLVAGLQEAVSRIEQLERQQSRSWWARALGR